MNLHSAEDGGRAEASHLDPVQISEHCGALTPSPQATRSGWRRSGAGQAFRAMSRRARLTALASARDRCSSGLKIHTALGWDSFHTTGRSCPLSPTRGTRITLVIPSVPTTTASSVPTIILNRHLRSSWRSTAMGEGRYPNYRRHRGPSDQRLNRILPTAHRWALMRYDAGKHVQSAQSLGVVVHS